MKKWMAGLIMTALMGASGAHAAEPADSAQMTDKDPYLWLENVEGKKALDWVHMENKRSLGVLEADPRFEKLKARALKDYDAKDKIAYGQLLGGAVHNFWQDSSHVRGIWRRTSMKSYASKEPKWITLIDFDKLAKEEGQNWVYKGRDCLAPDFGRCLIRLSHGGADAVVVREFDAVTKQFVKDGFVTPESKQWVSWIDRDTLMIATDFGKEADGSSSMNESGYPRQVRIWKRGTPLSDAKLILNADMKTVFNFPMASHRPDGTYTGVIQGPDFFTQIIYLLKDKTDDTQEPELKQLDLPRDIDFKGFFGGRMIIQMRKDWTVGGKTAPAGSLISVLVTDLMADDPARSLAVIYAPDDHSSIDGVSIGKDRIFLSVLHDVTGKLITATPTGDGWQTADMGMPKNGSLDVVSADAWSDNAYVRYESFLKPSSLYEVHFGGKPAEIKSLPARFDASGMVTEQKFATSKDGTKVPYFVIRPKNVPMDGSTPTILYGYGGFEIALTPSYMNGLGKLWLEEGGAYVIANIRGGGEYGPKWHQAALKSHRQRAYDDFIAVGEDLIHSGLTSTPHLGISGRSNGGLLMGVMTTERPDLWNAVICGSPLLDMLRFNKLLAGASWMGEYGNPDIPAERAWIEKYSPYQNVKADVKYPEVFFYTSTKDDRVHPGHARKMAHKMIDMGKPVLYYENTEGGHSAAANLKQRALTDALETVFMLKKLKD
ncbi:prolyl oligopeptidase family serine peptidase [Kordiimonas marina]|uniref:prolyl oligopeptidase family serine peptidase n=1 Tax=Kordiimonas marina TaxID=2872312 RepID=UPI001FF4E110|nr:prolyl oligopeptidase family serine peptidase [Kordiimonas marina]